MSMIWRIVRGVLIGLGAVCVLVIGASYALKPTSVQIKRVPDPERGVICYVI